jgi:hypothetical protein
MMYFEKIHGFKFKFVRFEVLRAVKISTSVRAEDRNNMFIRSDDIYPRVHRRHNSEQH